jgi:hypothetical protein
MYVMVVGLYRAALEANAAAAGLAEAHPCAHVQKVGVLLQQQQPSLGIIPGPWRMNSTAAAAAASKNHISSH